MIRMMIAAVLTVALMPLAGCATTSDYSKARTTVERIEAAYLRVRGPAELAIARLPEPARSRAIAALILADAALAVVRSDASPLERAAAARDLARAAAALVGVTRPVLSTFPYG